MMKPAPSRKSPASRRRGAILVLALAVVALAGATVLHSHLVAQARMKADRGALTTALLDAALEDAVQNSLLLLADDPDALLDHPGEPWAKPLEVEAPSGVNLYVSIEDANRRFDLNNLHTGPLDATLRPAEDMLADLLLYTGDYESSEHATALRDWIDPEDEGPREKRWYEEQILPQRPPNRPLASLTELPSVTGFTREMLDRKPPQPEARSFAELVTAIPFSRSRPVAVNVNTAEPEVLRCILGPAFPTVAETILGVRDRTPLVSLDSLAAVLPPREAATAAAFFSVRSDWFVINARAFHQGSSAACRVLVRRATDGAIEVMQWVK